MCVFLIPCCYNQWRSINHSGTGWSLSFPFVIVLLVFFCILDVVDDLRPLYVLYWPLSLVFIFPFLSSLFLFSMHMIVHVHVQWGINTTGMIRWSRYSLLQLPFEYHMLPAQHIHVLCSIHTHVHSSALMGNINDWRWKNVVSFVK